jgi:hypothetical protein
MVQCKLPAKSSRPLPEKATLVMPWMFLLSEYTDNWPLARLSNNLRSNGYSVRDLRLWRSRVMVMVFEKNGRGIRE